MTRTHWAAYTEERELSHLESKHNLSLICGNGIQGDEHWIRKQQENKMIKVDNGTKKSQRDPKTIR